MRHWRSLLVLWKGFPWSLRVRAGEGIVSALFCFCFQSLLVILFLEVTVDEVAPYYELEASEDDHDGRGWLPCW
jgi:hypothetical protein